MDSLQKKQLKTQLNHQKKNLKTTKRWDYLTARRSLAPAQEEKRQDIRIAATLEKIHVRCVVNQVNALKSRYFLHFSYGAEKELSDKPQGYGRKPSITNLTHQKQQSELIKAKQVRWSVGTKLSLLKSFYECIQLLSLNQVPPFYALHSSEHSGNTRMPTMSYPVSDYSNGTNGVDSGFSSRASIADFDGIRSCCCYNCQEGRIAREIEGLKIISGWVGISKARAEQKCEDIELFFSKLFNFLSTYADEMGSCSVLRAILHLTEDFCEIKDPRQNLAWQIIHALKKHYSCSSSFSTDETSTDDDDEPFECSICLDDIESSETSWVELACGHRFHEDCLCSWFETQFSCPFCRTEAM